MSLGATASAPACACETAVRASSSSVWSLSTTPSGAQHAAVAVARVLAQAQVGDHQQVRVGGLDRARGELDDPLVVPGAAALLVLGRGQAEQQHRGDPERGGLAGLLDRAVDAQVVDPGSDAIGVRRSPPATTNIGYTRCDADSSVSRVSPRSDAVWRRRRRRVAGKAMRRV